jgi:hypothetical protein
LKVVTKDTRVDRLPVSILRAPKRVNVGGQGDIYLVGIRIARCLDHAEWMGHPLDGESVSRDGSSTPALEVVEKIGLDSFRVCFDAFAQSLPEIWQCSADDPVVFQPNLFSKRRAVPCLILAFLGVLTPVRHINLQLKRYTGSHFPN